MKTIFLKKAFQKTLNSFQQFLPIIIGILLLVSLIIVAVPKEFYINIFTNNKIIDSLIGAVLGSIAVGNPIISYVIGGELLKQGISFIAITAFMLTWISVGVVQLPAESLMLGKRFSFARNILSFLTALIISVLTIATMSIL